VAAPTFEVDDETDTTGVVLVRRVIETLGRRQARTDESTRNWSGRRHSHDRHPCEF
jgi:hypothetical protein